MNRSIDNGSIPGICDQIDALRGDKEGLVGTLQAIRKALHVTCVCLGSVAPTRDRILDWIAPDMDPAIHEFYGPGGFPWGRNPWATTLARLAPGELMRTHLAAPRGRLKRTEFYDIFIRRFDILETLGFELFSGPEELFFFGVFRPEQWGPFDERTAMGVSRLYAALRRFAQLAARSAGGLGRDEPVLTLLHELQRRGTRLSYRQSQVYFLHHAGRSPKEIAGDLDISPGRVNQHLKVLRERLGTPGEREAKRILANLDRFYARRTPDCMN